MRENMRVGNVVIVRDSWGPFNGKIGTIIELSGYGYMVDFENGRTPLNFTQAELRIL